MPRETRQSADTEAGLHLLAGFHGTELDDELKALIRNFRIGGVVLFKRNVESPVQLRSLIEETQHFATVELGRSLWVAIDQEGGLVQRLAPPFTQLPSARSLSLAGPSSVAQWSSTAASDLLRMGIQINLAPVLDVVPDEPATHFMKDRSLGSEPLQVSELGRIWIQTMQERGVSATAKHFPGLGRAELDPHHFAPVIHWHSQAEMERDLLPFRAAIDAGVHCVMTSHALYPFLDPVRPATFSERINRGLLRDDMGFRGVLMSDDMDMAAVSGRYTWDEAAGLGLSAGIDFFLVCQRPENIDRFHQALVDAISGSSVLAAVHLQSLQRIARLSRLHSPDHNTGDP